LTFLKKHIGDILVFCGVIAVFFLTGAPKKKSNDSNLSIPIAIEQNNQAPLNLPTESNSLPQASTNIQDPIAQTLPLKQNNNSQTEQPPTNPYAVLMNREAQNQGDSIQNSLKELKGQAPSTEALIERNTYFKKLSEQLKDLQGNVNSEEEKPKEDKQESDTNRLAEELQEQDMPTSEIDELIENELNENVSMPGPQ